MTLRTLLYLGFLTGIFLAVGYWIGGESGMVTALLFAAVTNVISYWFSDKIVLWMYSAKKLEEKDAPNLHAIVAALTKKMGLPKPPIYLVPMPVPNAFATGRNPEHAAVAVTQGILDLLDRDELEGVLAHELAHVKNRDILIATIAATIAGALSVLVRLAYWTGMGGDRRERGSPLVGIFLLIMAPLLALLIQLAVSRSREYAADETGAQAVGSGRALASALEKLHMSVKHHPLRGTPSQQATAHLFIVNPFSTSTLLNLFSTHPPVQERVRRLMKI